MGKAEWGEDPEFFGPRHAHREGRLLRELRRAGVTAGLHLECAAGVGSLSISMAREEREVVAVDRSLRSLLHVVKRAAASCSGGRVVAVVADITELPFADARFSSASSAETLEHVPEDRCAVEELARVLEPAGILAGTVPAGPAQWSEWDDWAGHLRRFTRRGLEELLAGAGLEARAKVWGWPVLRTYDELFMKRVNRRRFRHQGVLGDDEALRVVSLLGSRHWLVRLVQAAFEIDRVFDGAPWGGCLLFVARKPAR